MLVLGSIGGRQRALIAVLSSLMGGGPGFCGTWPATDKTAHFSTSAVITAAILKVEQGFSPDHRLTTADRVLASGLSLAIGLGKEIMDQKRKGGALDSGDLCADAGGVIVGNLLQWEF